MIDVCSLQYLSTQNLFALEENDLFSYEKKCNTKIIRTLILSCQTAIFIPTTFLNRAKLFNS